jgi:hypothetical protein
MAEKHASEAHCLSLKEKGKRHARTKGLYVNRAFGSDCHHCVVDGDIDASVVESPKTGT